MKFSAFGLGSRDFYATEAPAKLRKFRIQGHSGQEVHTFEVSDYTQEAAMSQVRRAGYKLLAVIEEIV